MAKLNPKQYTDGYKDQKNFDRAVPVAGTYDVVNVKMQFQRVGRKATEKLRLITHVLSIVEAKDEDGAKAMVGHTFGQDIWWNLYKDGREGQLNFNGQRLVNMAIANGCGEEFDPEQRESLIGILTGTPYRIKISVETSRSDTGRDFYNVNVDEVKHLSTEAKKKYTSAPDWKTIMPPMESRMLEDANYSAGSKDKASGKSGSRRDEPAPAADDGGFADDDLPF